MKARSLNPNFNISSWAQVFNLHSKIMQMLLKSGQELKGAGASTTAPLTQKEPVDMDWVYHRDVFWRCLRPAGWRLQLEDMSGGKGHQGCIARLLICCHHVVNPRWQRKHFHCEDSFLQGRCGSTHLTGALWACVPDSARLLLRDHVKYTLVYLLWFIK